MKLLNNSSILDQLIIKKKSIRIILVTLLMLVILGLFLFFYQKDCYYINTLSKTSDEIVLLVSKEKINEIKKKNTILIDNVENIYSINKINSMDDFFMVYINLKIKQETIHKKEYKIYLGKEKIIEYLVRIINNK